MIQSLPIQNIVRRADVRPLNAEAVVTLSDSIASVGLINPIRVRCVNDGWEVIAGSHRLEACKRLGLSEIDCIVVSDDDLHAELAMIDENLMRAELSASERASQTARRKAIYLELHPETASGISQAAGMNAAQERGGQVGHDVDRFDTATAKATGQSERAVRRDAERGEKVIPEVIALISGTKLDTGTYLDRIKNLSPNDQVVAAKRDLALSKQQQTKRSNSAPLTEDQRAQKQCDYLFKKWQEASELARQKFLERIQTEIQDAKI